MYGGVAGEDGRLSPLCRSTPHKIRDPELLKNPQPNHAEFETFLLGGQPPIRGGAILRPEVFCQEVSMRFKTIPICLSLIAFATISLAQTKISGTVQCGKSDEQHALEVGDHLGSNPLFQRHGLPLTLHCGGRRVILAAISNHSPRTQWSFTLPTRRAPVQPARPTAYSL